MQNVVLGEVVGLRITARSYARCRGVEVVPGSPKLHIGTDGEPISSGQLERHPHAASVHDARRANEPTELHVGVSADDEGCLRRGEDGFENLRWRLTREDLHVVARG